MTSAQLQTKFILFLKKNGHDFSFQNKFFFDKESDVISFKDGCIYEYEFKIGESDFRKDQKKNRHSISAPNFFYYVVSDEIIINGDYPDYAGIYVHKYSKDDFSLWRLKKEATRIRETVATWSELYHLLKKV